MNEQWNNALDQVKDEYLSEAVSYRPRRHWPKVAGAAAAVLVLAVGWSVLRPEPSTKAPANGSLDSNSSGCLAPDGAAPGSASGEFWYGLIGGDPSDEPTEGIDNSEEEPPYYETLHFDTYAEFQTACQEQHRWYINDQVMVPFFGGAPMDLEYITVFEQEMYNEPWVWYFASSNPHITVRIPTTPSLAAELDPDISGADALWLLFPTAPNLHNREEFTDIYSEIREVEITTSDGVKTALYRQEADRDRIYLTFLQNGTLVTVAGPRNEIKGDWLEAFSLAPIDSL